MQGLLTDIELDIQELKYLIEAFTREPNVALREVVKRNVLQMRGRLDTLLLNLDAVVPTDVVPTAKEKTVQETEPIPPIIPAEPIASAAQTIAPIAEPVVLDVDDSMSIPILAERIKTATELSRSISLNDSFRFSRELFDGDAVQMNRVLQQIGEMSTYAAAVSFLLSKVKVSEENEAMADLLELLKKYFN